MSDGLSEQRAVKFHPDTIEALETLKADDGRTVAWHIRRAVDQYLRRKRRTWEDRRG